MGPFLTLSVFLALHIVLDAHPFNDRPYDSLTLKATPPLGLHDLRREISDRLNGISGEFEEGVIDAMVEISAKIDGMVDKFLDEITDEMALLLREKRDADEFNRQLHIIPQK